MRVDPQHPRDLDELDYVDAPLVGLNPSNEGTRPFQAAGKVALSQLCLLSGGDQEFNQESMTPASECFSKGSARHGALLAK